MMLGFALVVGGYAVFYWGLHHFKNVDCPGGGTDCPNNRVSLIDCLGIPKTWGVTQGQPVQLTGAESGNDATQGQMSNNASTGTNLLPASGTNFQSMILSQLGAPSSQNNITKLTAWNACEGNSPGQSGLGINNPFNVAGFGQLGISSENCCNPSPVQSSQNNPKISSFPSLADGTKATAIRISQPFAAAIKANLVSDGSGQAFAAAVGSSGWGTSGSCIAGYLK